MWHCATLFLLICKMTTGACEQGCNSPKKQEHCDSEQHNCQQYALVPYTNNGILAEFYETNKTISIPGIEKKFTIKQNWQDNGVAGVVWEAATVLSEYLHKTYSLQNKTVLELGAGTGLVGMVAASLGAKVTVTDLNKALPLLQENVDLNFPNNSATAPHVDELQWGEDVRKYLKFPFDFIVGADIIYLESSFDSLVETLSDLTKNSINTKIILSSKLRYDRVKVFVSKLQDRFSSVQLVCKDNKTNTVVYECN